TLTSGELLIKQSITIAGPGAGSLTVSGNHASRVFEVSEGKGKGKSVTTVILSGLTISNGYASGAGGGIYSVNNSTSALTLRGCTLSGNSAGAGGGIFYANGTLTLSGCTLSKNSATSGGGIFNACGSITVSGCTLSKNSATSGGGIYND